MPDTVTSLTCDMSNIDDYLEYWTIEELDNINRLAVVFTCHCQGKIIRGKRKRKNHNNKTTTAKSTKTTIIIISVILCTFTCWLSMGAKSGGHSNGAIFYRSEDHKNYH